jgi:vacuolar protein sorting-associated protein 13A/C
VGFGLRSTITGVAGGITGLVEKPYEGAKEKGFNGFMKGTFRGVSGLILMPLSGAIDFVSMTSEGIKN